MHSGNSPIRWNSRRRIWCLYLERNSWTGEWTRGTVLYYWWVEVQVCPPFYKRQDKVWTQVGPFFPIREGLERSLTLSPSQSLTNQKEKKGLIAGWVGLKPKTWDTHPVLHWLLVQPFSLCLLQLTQSLQARRHHRAARGSWPEPSFCGPSSEPWGKKRGTFCNLVPCPFNSRPRQGYGWDIALHFVNLRSPSHIPKNT